MEKHEAQVMAEMIEKWLGNPIARSVLKFCTKRDRCGRRVEIALKKYIGKDVHSCLPCNISYHIIKGILDSFTNKCKFDKKLVMENLNDYMFRKGLSSVLEGLAAFGPVKPFTFYSPFLVVWNYTKACNLNCKHCYEEAHVRAKDELTTEERMMLIDKMGELGIAYIAMSGGEPLISPDFFKVVAKLKQNEIAFSIATNGTLLTKEKAKELKKNDCRYVQISLDGATAKTHNWLRGPGAFQKTIQGIRNAVAEDMCVGLATTVTSKNYHEVPKIIELSEKLGADIWMHYNFIPTGRGKDIVSLDITPQQRERMLKMMAEEGKKRKISLLTTAPQYSRIAVQCNAGGGLTHFDTFSNKIGGTDLQFLAEFIGGCGCARLYIALEPNGDIQPCVFLPIKIGNIRKDDLGEVWKNNEILKKIRDREKFWGYCKDCKDRNICGGCRARSYGYFRDVSGPDPGCIYNIKDWNKITGR